MSKYRYLREILQEAYPKFKPEQVEKIMKRIKEIRDTEKQKQSSQYVERKLYAGDYVRWVISYAIFACDTDGTTWPHQPVYCYGLIVETANDHTPSVVVYIPRSCEYHMLDTSKYAFEVLSSAGPRETL